MKKQFFSILLSLFMVMLFPVTVFAEDTDNPMIKIDAPDEICAQQDLEFTIFAEEGVILDKKAGYDFPNLGGPFDITLGEDGQLHAVLPKELYDLGEESVKISVHGFTKDGVPILESKIIKISQEHVYVHGVCGCGVMLHTLTVPFTTTVNLGGNVAPGKTTFNLEVVDSQGEKLNFEGVESIASITTNGAGSYNGTMTFIGTYEQLMDMLSEGAFVKQVNAGEENWTYDDTVWGLELDMGEIAELSTDMPDYSISIYSTTFEEKENGKIYYLDSEVEKMAFTNTYTKSITDTTKPTESTENNTNGGKTKSPQTGDNSNLTLWLTLLVVSATGIISTGVYNKRKKSSRA